MVIEKFVENFPHEWSKNARSSARVIPWIKNPVPNVIHQTSLSLPLPIKIKRAAPFICLYHDLVDGKNSFEGTFLFCFVCFGLWTCSVEHSSFIVLPFQSIFRNIYQIFHFHLLFRFSMEFYWHSIRWKAVKGQREKLDPSENRKRWTILSLLAEYTKKNILVYEEKY